MYQKRIIVVNQLLYLPDLAPSFAFKGTFKSVPEMKKKNNGASETTHRISLTALLWLVRDQNARGK